MKFKEKRNSSGGILAVIILLILLGSGGYVYFSPAFEQNKPIIKVDNNIFWNLRSKLKIKLEDQSGIKYYKVIFKDGHKDIELNQEVLNDVQKEITVEINPPKLDVFYKGEDAEIYIETVDNSKWNFLEGNKAEKTVKVKIDTKKPVANVLSNSRYLQRGGSSAVVVHVKDENLKDAYIEFNAKHRFDLIPFYKEDYFVALVAWPIDFENFNKVNLIAIDKAQNKTITKIPFYIQKKDIKVDNINLSESFIRNVSASVLEQSFEKIPESLEDIFVYSNKDLRKKNVETIEKIAKEAMKNKEVKEFDIKPFRRLRGSKTVAGYAERRHYYLDGKKINEAWHLGTDWASVKKATIRTSNKGEVVFKDYMGLYGNTIIIDHGMGLCTLYAHTSTQDVNVGDTVKERQKIAKTGATGAVFGDHLHFGVLVQGVEVNPIEWMDKNWIKTRITDILQDAKKQINGKK